MAQKKAVKKTVAKKAITKDKRYKVVMHFNDQTFSFSTDNLPEALQEVKPTFLKTRVLFTITEGDKVCERMLLLNQGKMLWRNRMALEAFVSRLIFK